MRYRRVHEEGASKESDLRWNQRGHFCNTGDNVMDTHIEKLRHALLQFWKRTKSIDVLNMRKEVVAQVAELPPPVAGHELTEMLNALPPRP